MQHTLMEKNISSNNSSELVSSKIKWIYKNSPEYKERIDALLNDASVDIQIPFFEISKKEKKEIQE